MPTSDPDPQPPNIPWRQSPIAHPNRPSFLSLPRELRDQIYTHCLCTPGAILIYTQPALHQRQSPLSSKILRLGNCGPSAPQPVTGCVVPALLAACKQLHAEAAPVLYGRNAFRVLLLGEANLAPRYRALVKHVVLTTESAQLVLGSRDLDAVGYGWKHRFWPRVRDGAAKVLELFPGVERIVVVLKAGAEESGWRPAFFRLGGQSPVRRVELAAEWMGARTSWDVGEGRLRDVLGLVLEAPAGRIEREEYVGSRFAPDEEEWDYEEFGAAFELMKVLD